MSNGLDEVRHQLPVTPAMAVGFLLPNGLFPRPKVCVREVRHIPHHIAHAAHDACSAPMVGRESLHVKGGRNPILKKHIHRVMIGLVVLHMVHAAPIVAFTEVIHDGIAV